MRRSTATRDPFATMISPSAKEVFIQGVTSDGRPFRPSDWAERLAGVMSQFRPGGPRPGGHLGRPEHLTGAGLVVVQGDHRPDGLGHAAHQLGLEPAVDLLVVADAQIGEPALVLLETEEGAGEVEQHRSRRGHGSDSTSASTVTRGPLKNGTSSRT